MQLPLRFITDDSDLRFQIYSVVDSEDKVICNVPFDRTMNSSMDRAKDIGLKIVESLNLDLAKSIENRNEVTNFCKEGNSDNVVKKRAGNPNWFKGMKRPNGAGRKKKGLLDKVISGLTDHGIRM